MAISAASGATRSPPPFITATVFQIVAACLDIRSVWSLDHDPGDGWMTQEPHPLLVFADAATLARLRKSDELHSNETALMVVVDGDHFESAWPPDRLSGSLARWAWRQTTPDEAYYDEARWASGERGAIMRVRRKAFLVWQQTSTDSR